MTDELADKYEKMIAKDLAKHQKSDNCICPLKCPNGCGLAIWDMGMEGHYCSGCGWYDGVK